MKAIAILSATLCLAISLAAAVPLGAGPVDDPNQPVVRAENGELAEPLVDRDGNMLVNPKILLDRDLNPGFNYGSQKVRGVCIGGWLVAEPWITPSLFDK